MHADNKTLFILFVVILLFLTVQKREVNITKLFQQNVFLVKKMLQNDYIFCEDITSYPVEVAYHHIHPHP